MKMMSPPGQYQQYNDAVLVEYIKKNDTHAHNEFCLRYYSPLKNFIAGKFQLGDMSHDITQESLLKALQKIETYTQGSVSIFYWLKKIAYREALAFIKKRRGHQNKQEEVKTTITERANTVFQNPETTMYLKEVQKMFLNVRTELKKNHPKFAQVIQYRFFEDKSVSEIASLMNTTKNNVSKMTKRAIDQLTVLWQAEQSN